MPVNVRRFCTSVSLVLFGFFAIINAQTQQASPEPAPQTANINVAKAPTSAEIMRDRISKAKAFLAVRNYPAAIYELENIRRETNDVSVNSVVNVLLMNSYIEQGDHKRAAELLKTHYDNYKRNNANAAAFYQAVAAQVVSGARSQVERYRSFGLMVSDRNLPLEAVRDIEAMRVLLETVIEQAKESSAEPAKAAAGVALLEEATTTRAAIARDDYDARRWRDAAADSREQLANSRSVVKNAVDLAPVETAVAQKTPVPAPVETVKVAETVPAPKSAPDRPSANPFPGLIASNDAPTTGAPVNKVEERPEPSERPIRIAGNKPTTQTEKKPAPKSEDAAEKKTGSEDASGPLEVGSLLPYATRQTAPVYPAPARQMRASGTVRVDILVDENGDVVEVQNTTGHTLLQSAARDAIRRWKFKPFTRDGQPVRAIGFVNFNFLL